MNRPYFTFFRSYFEAVLELEDRNDQLETLMAICSYSLTKEEPEISSNVAKAIFKAIRPTIDKNIKQYESGITPKKKRNVSEPQANDKRMISEPQTNKDKDKDKEKDNKNNIGRFTPPPLADVQSYFKEKGINDPKEPEKFIDFYTSKGWMVGKNKMKDWKAAVRNWIKGIDKSKVGFNNFDNQRSYDNDELERLLVAN